MVKAASRHDRPHEVGDHEHRQLRQQQPSRAEQGRSQFLDRRAEQVPPLAERVPEQPRQQLHAVEKPVLRQGGRHDDAGDCRYGAPGDPVLPAGTLGQAAGRQQHCRRERAGQQCAGGGVRQASRGVDLVPQLGTPYRPKEQAPGEHPEQHLGAPRWAPVGEATTGDKRHPGHDDAERLGGGEPPHPPNREAAADRDHGVRHQCGADRADRERIGVGAEVPDPGQREHGGRPDMPGRLPLLAAGEGPGEAVPRVPPAPHRAYADAGQDDQRPGRPDNERGCEVLQLVVDAEPTGRNRDRQQGHRDHPDHDLGRGERSAPGRDVALSSHMSPMRGRRPVGPQQRQGEDEQRAQHCAQPDGDAQVLVGGDRVGDHCCQHGGGFSLSGWGLPPTLRSLFGRVGVL